MSDTTELKQAFRKHQNVTNAKFESFGQWADSLSKGFEEMKTENDLFYDSIFDIFDRMETDLSDIKKRLDKANI